MSSEDGSGGRVIVAGSVNVDLIVEMERLPIAGETVHAHKLSRQLGGKGANQAVGVARAGAPAILLAAIGDDADGAFAHGALMSAGVDTTRFRRVPAATGCAIVATSRADNQIVVIPGANAALDPQTIEDIAIGADDVCLTQMETPLAVATALFTCARGVGATTIFNPAPASTDARRLLPLTDILVVNESELRLLTDATGGNPLDDDVLAALAARLEPVPPAVIVTLGGDGVALVRGDAVRRVAPHLVPVADTTGAGDCFCGYLAAALVRGDPIETSVIEANAAAALSVGALGAASAIPTRATTRAFLDGMAGTA